MKWQCSYALLPLSLLIKLLWRAVNSHVRPSWFTLNHRSPANPEPHIHLYQRVITCKRFMLSYAAEPFSQHSPQCSNQIKRKNSPHQHKLTVLVTEIHQTCTSAKYSMSSQILFHVPTFGSSLISNVSIYSMAYITQPTSRITHCYTPKFYSLCVDYQSIPLSFDVILRWLFGDVKTIKFQLPCHFLFTLKNHKGHLQYKKTQ